jgi:hypothetical protein
VLQTLTPLIVLVRPNLLQVELWRADLMSAVLDVDAQGIVKSVGIKDQPVFSPHLVLGLPPRLIIGEMSASL